MERVFKDKVPYDAWEREGFITVTNSEIVDQNVVMDYVLNFAKKMNWIFRHYVLIRQMQVRS